MLSFVKDTTGAHQSSKKQKCFRARFGTFKKESILLVARAKTCSKVLLLFARLVCASHIFNKRKHVRACFSKRAFAKSSFGRLVCARPKITNLSFTYSAKLLIYIRNILFLLKFQNDFSQFFLEKRSEQMF